MSYLRGGRHRGEGFRAREEPVGSTLHHELLRVSLRPKLYAPEEGSRASPPDRCTRLLWERAPKRGAPPFACTPWLRQCAIQSWSRPHGVSGQAPRRWATFTNAGVWSALRIRHKPRHGARVLIRAAPRVRRASELSSFLSLECRGPIGTFAAPIGSQE